MVHTFTNVDWLNSWLVYGRRNSFASQEIQGSEVVSQCKILIEIHKPLIIPNQVPVDAHYGETINLDLLPICPNN